VRHRDLRRGAVGGLYEYGDDVGIVRVGADGEAPAKIVIAELNGHDNSR